MIDDTLNTNLMRAYRCALRACNCETARQRSNWDLISREYDLSNLEMEY